MNAARPWVTQRQLNFIFGSAGRAPSVPLASSRARRRHHDEAVERPGAALATAARTDAGRRRETLDALAEADRLAQARDGNSNRLRWFARCRHRPLLLYEPAL